VPLKQNIAADLQDDGFPAAYELIVSAVGWYMRHFAYQYALQAGAKRINLNGKEVGTVTEQEWLKAQKRIKEDQQRVKERNLGYPVRTMMSPHSSGRISDDMVGKVDAPPISPVKAASVSPAELQVSPELTPLYEALRAANNAISATPNGELRAALASAALGVVVKEAQRAIASFSSNQ
jgi:ProQ/FINO family